MKKLYGVIGHPIAHSMSPVMHNDAFTALQLPGYYHAFNIKPEDLEAAIKGMKAIGIAGFNVTIPHKSAIIPLLDEIDPLAEAIGAVNTVVLKDGKWIGFNTDGHGFISALKEDWKSNLQKEKVLLVGAGGAAKAIYYTLASEGVLSIDICNRTLERGEYLAAGCPFPSKTNALSLSEAEASLERYTLIIQTTSIGMSPKVQDAPLSLNKIKPGTFVSDIIYNPFKTTFLQQAYEKGAFIQNGVGMFVYQGALAFKKWTGLQPDTERMRKIVIEQLGGYNVNR